VVDRALLARQPGEHEDLIVVRLDHRLTVIARRIETDVLAYVFQRDLLALHRLEQLIEPDIRGQIVQVSNHSGNCSIHRTSLRNRYDESWSPRKEKVVLSCPNDGFFVANPGEPEFLKFRRFLAVVAVASCDSCNWKGTS